MPWWHGTSTECTHPPGMGCRKKGTVLASSRRYILPDFQMYCESLLEFMRILALRKKKEKEDGACWQNE